MKLKLLYQKLDLLPVFIGLTYIVLVIDTIKYPGSVATHFFIDAKIYFALTITLLILSGVKSKLSTLSIKLNNILLIPLFLFYLTFLLLEGSHFTNYILNVYRIHLDGLIVLVLFSFALFIVNKFKEEIPKPTNNIRLAYSLIIFFITLFIVKNASLVADMAFNRNSYILFHLNDSYDQKMTYEWGKFYQFMVFARSNTPTDSTIIIPPMQDPWLMGSGNDHFVRAFLFPRKIIPKTLIIPEKDLQNFGSNTYILMTWGKEACKPDPECHGWPRQDIQATRIVYKDPDSPEVIEVKQNTIYRLNGSQYVYGLIKL